MATYFGYVEREADSYVNWADVGRNMSATIDNIQRVRDEKKALIEKAYNEDLDYIQSRPAGEHETLNAWSLNFGNTSAENLKLKYSQLKQGKISVNDFVRFRQNLTDSVEKIYGVTGRLQEIYKNVEERTRNKENQLIERETKVLLEKYGQLENTLPYVNGLTGTVAVGLTEITKDAEGKEVRRLRQGEDAYLTPDQLQAAAEEKFNNFDEQPVIDAWVDKLGDVQQDIRRIGGASIAGQITSITDVTYDNIMTIINSMPENERPAQGVIDALKIYLNDFEEAESYFIDGILAKETDASALLTEKIGIDPYTKKPYTIVWKKEDATSSDKLYVEKTKDGRFIPIFDANAEKDEDKKQMAALKDYLKSQIRVKLDRKAETKVYTEPTPPVVRGGSPGQGYYAARGRQQSAANMGTYIRDLYSGDMKKKQETLRTLRGDGDVVPDETYFKTGSDGSIYLHVTRSTDGASEDIKMTNPDGTPYQDVVTFGRSVGSWLYGSDTSKKILLENLPQFEAALLQTPTFNVFDLNQKQQELWDPQQQQTGGGFWGNVGQYMITGTMGPKGSSKLNSNTRKK